MKRLTVGEHLDEIRARVLILTALFLLCFCIAYLWIEPVLEYLTRTVGQLVYLSPAELFMVEIKLALALALLVTLPVMLWHVQAFIGDALPPPVRQQILLITTIATALFYAGAAFALFIVVPITMQYFLSLQTAHITPLLSVDAYVSFVLLLVLGFGVTFLIPVPVVLLITTGVVTVDQLIAARRYVIVGLAILAAAVTPSPDAVTMLVLFIPLWCLYEVSVLVGWLLTRKRKFIKE